MHLRTFLITLSALPFVSALPSNDRPSQGLPRFHKSFEPKLGAAASADLECSGIGTNALRAGGNAADAFVATVFCIGVKAMYHSGIGGGGFMLVRGPTGDYEFIDFRETAPAAASKDMYKDNYEGSKFGGLASGVPGELRGLEYLHKHYGRLSWREVIQPSITLATKRYGFRVNEDLVKYMNLILQLVPDNFFVNDPAWAIDFAPNGTMVGLNDMIYRKRYANTLETIASEGADAFYTGSIAKATIAAVQRGGGIMTMKDLEDYQVAIRKPAQINYRGFKVTSCAAPSSGAVALATLKTLEGYDDFGQEDATNISTYRLNEAMRWAYAKRAYLGDPSFTPGLESYEDEMISDEAAAEIRGKITESTHDVSYYNPKGLEILQTPGTSHISVADRSGMAVSGTTTENLWFGSTLIVPETGFPMNDEMNDFSIPEVPNTFGYRPSPNNFIEPGKRPLSSMSPTIAEDASGRLYYVIGAAGGSRITTGTIQNLWNVLDRNMTAAQALRQPRFHDQLEPNVAEVEYDYNNQTVAFLMEKGVDVVRTAPTGSLAQAVRLLPDGIFEAAGEPRLKHSGGIAV
ncbi:MAG: hypothetical protein M1831_006976 [Alyxoria varia]|nr:MAG: hypothetical protein M1831_006976 [Alyxoria varia]